MQTNSCLNLAKGGKSEIGVAGHGFVELNNRSLRLLAEDMGAVSVTDSVAIVEGQSNLSKDDALELELALLSEGAIPVYTEFQRVYGCIKYLEDQISKDIGLNFSAAGTGTALVGRNNPENQSLRQHYAFLSQLEIIRAMYVAHYRFKSDTPMIDYELPDKIVALRKQAAVACLGALSVPLTGYIGLGACAFGSIKAVRSISSLKRHPHEIASSYSQEHMLSPESVIRNRARSAVGFRRGAVPLPPPVPGTRVERLSTH